MKSMFSANKVGLFLLGLPILLVLLCTLFYKLSPDWRHYTSPLPDEVKEELCDKFVVSNEYEILCSEENETYGPDFYPHIEKVLLPGDGEGLDFETVLILLGPYQTICESFPQDSQYYQRCTYDLRGDRVHHFGIYFNKNNFVDNVYMRVQTP